MYNVPVSDSTSFEDLNNSYLEYYSEFLRLDDIYRSKSKPKGINDAFSTIGPFIKTKLLKTEMEIRKPIYKSHYSLLEDNYNDTKTLESKYTEKKKEYLYDTSNKHSILKELTELTEQLGKQKKSHEDIHKCLSDQHERYLNKKHKLSVDIEEYNTDRKNILDNIENTTDSILKTKLIQSYLSSPQSITNNKFALIDLEEHLLSTQLFSGSEHNCMILLPLFINKETSKTETSQNKSPEKNKKELPKKVVKELKKVIRKNQKKDTNKEANKDTNKDSVGKKPVEETKKSPTREMLKKIIFKTLEECESSKRTKPYYMSKEELIKHIHSDPELLLKFGKNITSLKKLSKKDLCAQIPLLN
jgi:hypothetical protein